MMIMLGAGRRIVRILGVFVFAAGCAAGCTGSGTGSSSTAATSGLPSASTATRQPTAGHVRVLGVWSGPEFDSFTTVESVWEKDTGGSVEWQGTQDLPGDLDASIRAGHPPDIAILPNLAVMQQLAAAGKLVPLDSVLDMSRVHADYAPAWTDLGSYHGTLYGIFYKVADKATVWYNPRALAAAGYSVPKTWHDLMALAAKMVADGRTPFSIAAANGPAIGWPLTDWISEIVLNACGPDLYDGWIAARIPWTDPCIKRSFAMFDSIVRAKGYVRGGTEAILATTDSAGSYPLYSDPPTAYLYYLASFAQGFITQMYPNLTPGRDYGFFPFPSIDPRYRGAVTVGADVVVMLHDTPAARSFMAYLAGARAQEEWSRLGGFTSVNRCVSPDAYPDPVARAVADDLSNAELIRFSAGDMMPAAVQRAWWQAMLNLVKNPDALDSVLDSLTRLARSNR